MRSKVKGAVGCGGCRLQISVTGMFEQHDSWDVMVCCQLQGRVNTVHTFTTTTLLGQKNMLSMQYLTTSVNLKLCTCTAGVHYICLL